MVMADTEDMTTTQTPKTNRYAAPCNAGCGKTVEPGAGVLVGKMVGGRWLVRHATCPGKPAMPVLRRPAPARMVTHTVDPDRRYVGRTWAEVMEANEFFDGEPELTAAAHHAWVIANARAEMERDPAMARYRPYLDTHTHWGDANEAIMHAMEAENDRNNP